VTEHPTAAWTANQLVQTFYDQKTPRCLIRDRDGIYGLTFQAQMKALEIQEVVIPPHSPWQSPYVERVIGTLRCECLDHCRHHGRSSSPAHSAQVFGLLPW
jgi:hypothetical protein